jgi:hypothetical protein
MLVQYSEYRDPEEWIIRFTTGEPNARPEGGPSGVLVVTLHDVGGETKAMLDGLGVHNRKQGEATRLMQSAIVRLKELGVHELWSYSATVDALKFRRKVFGDAIMHFYDPEHPEKGFLPMSVDQAIDSYDLHHTDDDYNYYYDLGIAVNLDGIDTAGWASPLSNGEALEYDDYSLYPRIPDGLLIPASTPAQSHLR